MTQQFKYVWPARFAALPVIRAAAALGWHQYAYDVADHMPNADDGFELLAELEYQPIVSTMRSRRPRIFW